MARIIFLIIVNRAPRKRSEGKDEGEVLIASYRAPRKRSEGKDEGEVLIAILNIAHFAFFAKPVGEFN